MMTYAASLECDGNYGVCASRIDGDTAAAVRKEARETGWLLSKRGDFCAYCQQHEYRLRRSAKLNKHPNPFMAELRGEIVNPHVVEHAVEPQPDFDKMNETIGREPTGEER